MKLLAAASKARFTATHVVENGGHNVSSSSSYGSVVVRELTHSFFLPQGYLVARGIGI